MDRLSVPIIISALLLLLAVPGLILVRQAEMHRASKAGVEEVKHIKSHRTDAHGIEADGSQADAR